MDKHSFQFWFCIGVLLIINHPIQAAGDEGISLNNREYNQTISMQVKQIAQELSDTEHLLIDLLNDLQKDLNELSNIVSQPGASDNALKLLRKLQQNKELLDEKLKMTRAALHKLNKATNNVKE